jgi:hypothetical protein
MRLRERWRRGDDGLLDPAGRPFATGETTEGVALVGVARRRSSWRRRDEPPAVDMGPLLTSEEKAKGECGL